MNRDELRSYAKEEEPKNKDRNPLLNVLLSGGGSNELAIPGVPLNSNLQMMIFIVLGWLFSLVAAKYGLNTSELEEIIVNTDQQVNEQITNAVSNYDTYRTVIIGILLVVINGGNVLAARKVATSNAVIADSQSRAIVSYNLVEEARSLERTRSLELDLEKTRASLHNGGVTEFGSTSPVIPVPQSIPTTPAQPPQYPTPTDTEPAFTFPDADEMPPPYQPPA